MSWWNKNEYPVEKIRQWIAEGKTQQWIADKLGFDRRLIQKVCKKQGIKCQRTGPRSGAGHPEWKGGCIIDKDGYMLLYKPGHPYARNPRKKYVLAHRLAMEKHLGRYLTYDEVVHHKNSVKSDNRLENLQLFSRNGLHLKYELKGKVPNWSEDGKRRVLLACQKGVETRLRNKLNGS